VSGRLVGVWYLFEWVDYFVFLSKLSDYQNNGEISLMKRIHSPYRKGLTLAGYKWFDTCLEAYKNE